MRTRWSSNEPFRVSQVDTQPFMPVAASIEASFRSPTPAIHLKKRQLFDSFAEVDIPPRCVVFRPARKYVMKPCVPNGGVNSVEGRCREMATGAVECPVDRETTTSPRRATHRAIGGNLYDGCVGVAFHHRLDYGTCPKGRGATVVSGGGLAFPIRVVERIKTDGGRSTLCRRSR